MTDLEAKLERLQGLEEIVADCPECDKSQLWWTFYTPGGKHDLGKRCAWCDYVADVPEGPPAILCAGCGHELQRLEDVAFHCPACNRVVRP